MDPFIGVDWTATGDGTNAARVLGVLVPLVTALLTRRHATARVKAVVTFVLVGVVAVLTQGTVEGWTFDPAVTVSALFNTYVAAIAAYYGLLKPTGATGAVADATAGFGVGRDPYDADGDGTLDSPLGG